MPAVHQIVARVQARGTYVVGALGVAQDILESDLEPFRTRLGRAAVELNWPAPADLMVDTWWEQARTLEEE